MSAGVVIVIILVFLLIAAGVATTIYFLTKKKPVQPPQNLEPPQGSSGPNQPPGSSGPNQPPGSSGPNQPPGSSGPNQPPGGATGSFERQTGICTGLRGISWNIGGRSNADCAQACLNNSASGSTPPEYWTKCTGWTQLSSASGYSCLLYDYVDIRGSGTGSSFCEVLKV